MNSNIDNIDQYWSYWWHWRYWRICTSLPTISTMFSVVTPRHSNHSTSFIKSKSSNQDNQGHLCLFLEWCVTDFWKCLLSLLLHMMPTLHTMLIGSFFIFFIFFPGSAASVIRAHCLTEPPSRFRLQCKLDHVSNQMSMLIMLIMLPRHEELPGPMQQQHCSPGPDRHVWSSKVWSPVGNMC